MKFPKLKDLKESSVYITPNFPVLQTKRYKFSFYSVLGAIIGYSIFVTIVVILILIFSPARNVVFFFENEKLDAQVEKVKELEGKVVFLTHQLEKLASTNEKLKYAIILASTDSLDSTAAIYDSLRQSDPELNKTGGNISAVFRDFLNLFSQDETKEFFFIAPVDGIIIKDFQPEIGHMGIDYGVRKGTNVHASMSGLVVFSGFTPDFGNTIIILHSDNYITIYRHCESLLKRERDFAEKGEVIALSGNSGYKSSGPHLHFEIWLDGKPVDPKKFIINN
jgi:murein DD-endopeptidase MepM/ murein hydrolase activator NlpD